MELKGQSVIIIGMGKSGISSANLCNRQGARVTLYDGKDESNFTMMMEENPQFNYLFGDFDDALLFENKFMILSPGVPTDLPFILKAKGHEGIEVIGEIELAYRFSKGQIIGITGTNGKTTTTSLVGDIVKLYQENTYVVGNIGAPYTDIADKTEDQDICVIELSSYQLESIVDFRADIACVLNVTEDHLQRHKTMDNYAKTKMRITENQRVGDLCILNAMDDYCRTYSKDLQMNLCWFSCDEIKDVYVDGDEIWVRRNQGVNRFMSIKEIPLLGSHNIENVLAAIGICIGIGISDDLIHKGIMNFPGVPHRIEFVEEIQGVRYYNDSKATNPDAAIKAVEAMDRSTILLAGGMDKGSDYKPWIKTFQPLVRGIVLYGETKEDIKKACINEGFKTIVMADNLEEATIKASEMAVSGENILLSPACASWDMFKNFEVRGDLFKEIVKRIGSEYYR